MSLSCSRAGKNAFDKPEQAEAFNNIASLRSSRRCRQISNSGYFTKEPIDRDGKPLKPMGHDDAAAPGFYFHKSKYRREDFMKKTHPQRFTMGGPPGIRMAPEVNDSHRIYVYDMQRHGKWDRERKAAYYKAYDEELKAQQPHDEKFRIDNAEKFWTRTKVDGPVREKLDVNPERGTGRHMKYGMYPGRYADVKPPLHDIVDDLKDKTTKQKVTKPEPVPASIKQIRDREHVNLKFQGESGYDTFRPGNTLATWEMGFRYTHR